jgi:molecular chaperone DnaJ
MSKADYYELLSVTRQSTAVEIKAAYRKKALQYHPDRNPDDAEAEEMFKIVAEAYDVLSNDQKRSVYDQYGHDGLQGGMGGGFSQGFGNAEDIFSSFGDIFEDFFGVGMGGQGHQQSRARRGSDLQTEVGVDFLEACFGTDKEIKVKRHITCEDCDGSGAKEGSSPESCSYCHGRGQVQVRQGMFAISTSCPQCQGKGKVIRDKCGSCHGNGVVKQERKLNVKVPAGVSDGMRLLMRGEGEVGKNGGGTGDLFVYIHVKAHDEFQRDEDNIHSELKVIFTDLALGCELKVNTIEGEDTLKIKAGTQSGERLRMKGKGIANVRTGRRGDHFIHIQAVTPTKLNAKQKELLESLSKEFGANPKSGKKRKKKSLFG